MYAKAGYNTSAMVVDNDNQFAHKKYVDDAISSNNPSISDLPPPTANVGFAGYKLTNLGNATLATDALNR